MPVEKLAVDATFDAARVAAKVAKDIWSVMDAAATKPRMSARKASQRGRRRAGGQAGRSGANPGSLPVARQRRCRAGPSTRWCASAISNLFAGGRGGKDLIEELLGIQVGLPLSMPYDVVRIARARQIEKTRCLNRAQRSHQRFEPSAHDGFFRQVGLCAHRRSSLCGVARAKPA